MSQLSLFESAAPERSAPNTEFIEKRLRRLLRLLRNAQEMPLSAAEAASWETRFPELAAHLAAEDAEILNAEFASELARLRTAA